jgi:hypothetical protein
MAKKTVFHKYVSRSDRPYIYGKKNDGKKKPAKNSRQKKGRQKKNVKEKTSPFRITHARLRVCYEYVRVGVIQFTNEFVRST